MSNIKISPTGREYAISSKADWPTWKFCLSLNIDELEAYIMNLRSKIKDDVDDIKVLRRRIRIAEDTHIIKRRCPSIENFEDMFLDDIKHTSAGILTQFGYQNTSIYYQEVSTIVDTLKEEKLILSKCKYNEYVYACVIVSEILDYYKTKYEEEELISIFDINPQEYYDLKIILNKWMTGNYWLN